MLGPRSAGAACQLAMTLTSHAPLRASGRALPAGDQSGAPSTAGATPGEPGTRCSGRAGRPAKQIDLLRAGATTRDGGGWWYWIDLNLGRYDAALDWVELLPPEGMVQNGIHLSQRDAPRLGLRTQRRDRACTQQLARQPGPTLESRLEQTPDDARLASSLGRAFAALGLQGRGPPFHGRRAVDLMSDLEEPPLSALAASFIWPASTPGSVEVDEALDLLEQIFSRPAVVSFPYLESDPVFHALRDHPRYRRLKQKHAWRPQGTK